MDKNCDQHIPEKVHLECTKRIVDVLVPQPLVQVVLTERSSTCQCLKSWKMVVALRLVPLERFSERIVEQVRLVPQERQDFVEVVGDGSQEHSEVRCERIIRVPRSTKKVELAPQGQKSEKMCQQIRNVPLPQDDVLVEVVKVVLEGASWQNL